MDWWTLCIVPLMSRRTECIADNGVDCAEAEQQYTARISYLLGCK